MELAGIIFLELDFKDVSSKHDLSETGLKDLRKYRMNSQYRLGFRRFI